MHDLVLHVAIQEISQCVHWWLVCCTMRVQFAKGVQPHRAPESNQSGSGQVRLLKPTIIHTLSHTPNTTLGLGTFPSRSTFDVLLVHRAALRRFLLCPSFIFQFVSVSNDTRPTCWFLPISVAGKQINCPDAEGISLVYYRSWAHCGLWKVIWN